MQSAPASEDDQKPTGKSWRVHPKSKGTRKMNAKPKALIVGVLAALTVSALAVMSASANEKGHFVSTGTPHVEIVGIEAPKTAHTHHFKDLAAPAPIGCEKVSYLGKTAAETVTSINVAPSYTDCYTTEDGEKVPVTVNGCTYTFTVAEKTTDNTEQTAHLLCPVGKALEIHHPDCTITILPQTINTGITYITQFEDGKHTITLKTNINLSITRHGLCRLVLPLHGTGNLSGAATVKALDTNKQLANITAT